MSETISIIIPVFNSEKYLKRCLDSVSKQTFADFEVILIDDGSEDSSGRICDEYAKKDKRFHVIHQANQGQAAARNVGIGLANGKWIHFVDSDDCIHPQMLEILLHAVETSNADMSMCGFVEAKEVPQSFWSGMNVEDNYAVSLVCENCLKDILENGNVRYWVVCGKLIRREIVQSCLFEKGRIYEDNAVVYRWMYNSKKIANVNKNLYFYYINDTGTTKNTFSEKQLDRLWALDQQISFYKNIKYHAMYQLIASRYVLACASCYKSTNNKAIQKEIKRLVYKRVIVDFRAIKLNPKEQIYIWEAFHPTIMKYYWIAHNVCGKRKVNERQNDVRN